MIHILSNNWLSWHFVMRDNHCLATCHNIREAEEIAAHYRRDHAEKIKRLQALLESVADLESGKVLPFSKRGK